MLRVLFFKSIYKMKPKLIIILCSILFLSLSGSAQKTSEIGAVIGGSYYMGDINHSKLFYSTQLSYGLLYRKNIHDHHSYRLQFIKEKLTGNDADFPSGYQQARLHSFSTDVYEFGMQYEFNFFPYNIRKHLKSTTYITTGASFALIIGPTTLYRPSAVIGMGAKQGFGKRLTIGIEWTYRYAFTDNLDALPENHYDPLLTPLENKQINNENSNDWYSLAGIVISYNFASTKKWCPAYDRR